MASLVGAIFPPANYLQLFSQTEYLLYVPSQQLEQLSMLQRCLLWKLMTFITHSITFDFPSVSVVTYSVHIHHPPLTLPDLCMNIFNVSREANLGY